MTDPLAPADAALVAALDAPSDDDGGELLTLEALAEAADVSLPLLEAIAREGLLVPRTRDPDRYALADADVVGAGLALVEAGLPLAELLDIARRTDDAMRGIAAHAVDVFVDFVRDPVQGTAASDDEAAERLVDAFRTMLPAVETLVGSHFRSLLLAAARERIATEAGDARGTAGGDEPADDRGDGRAEDHRDGPSDDAPSSSGTTEGS